MESVHTMVVKKFMARVVEALPSWELTKYYGRVCWFQLQCLKYRIQTSETWFNLKSKYMPGSLKSEIESEEKGKQTPSEKAAAGLSQASAVAKGFFANIPKVPLKNKIEKLRGDKKDAKEEEASMEESPEMIKTDKKTKRKEASKS